MAHTLVRLARSAPTNVATDAAVTAERLVTHLAFTYLIGALPAENTFAINTSRRQAIFMGQVAVMAKISALAGQTAYRADQRFQTMPQRIPDGISADFGGAIFNANRHEELRLPDDLEIKQG